MNQITTALLVLIGALIASRFVSEAGIKTLSTEQKGHLVEIMAPFRKFGLIVWILLVALAYKNPIYIIVGFMVYIVAHQGYMHWQSKRLSFPPVYAKYSIGASVIILLGIGLYAAIMMFPT